MRKAIAVALVVALTASILNADPKRIECTIATPDHPEPRPLFMLRIDGVDYLDVHDVALLFRATRTWHADVGRMLLDVGGKEVELILGNTFANVDQDGENLYSPILWEEDRMVVPMALVTEVMDPLVRERMSWDAEALQLRVDTSEPSVSAVVYSSEEDATTIELRTARELPCLVQETDKDKKGRRVIARIPNGVLTNKLIGTFPGKGDVESLKSTQLPGMATLEFDLRSNARPLQSVRRVSPTKVVLRFGSQPWIQGAAFVDSFPSQSQNKGDLFGESTEEMQVPAHRPRVVRNVLIDPGHGGSDEGSASPQGHREKDITLTLAQRLRADLLDRAPDLDVRLTREDDRYVSNEERRSMANDWRADLFISLHCDAWFDNERRGFSVATWGIPAVNPFWNLPSSAVRVGNVVRDTDILANSILLKMDKGLSLPNRGRSDAALDVLAGLAMPGVLVECGYLTSSDDRKLLTSEGFPKNAAKAISEGIVDFRTHFAKGWVGEVPIEEPPTEEVPPAEDDE